MVNREAAMASYIVRYERPNGVKGDVLTDHLHGLRVVKVYDTLGEAEAVVKEMREKWG